MKMKEIISSGDPEYDRLSFGWEINTNCQYRCGYCYAHKMLTWKFKEQHNNVYNNVLKRLRLNSIPNFRIDILGGEPTLHPRFHTIITELNNMDKCDWIMINTNAGTDINILKDLSNLKSNKIEVSASYHYEYSKFQKFMDNVIELNDQNNIVLTVTVNVAPEMTAIPSYKKIISSCIDNNVEVGLNFINPTDIYTKQFTSEFHQALDIKDMNTHVCNDRWLFISKDGSQGKFNLQQIHAQELNRFKGFNCIPKMWLIDPEGKFYNMCTGESLHPLNKNIKKCVQCPKDVCVCEELLHYHKTAPGENLPRK